jgi:hypothetical protein
MVSWNVRMPNITKLESFASLESLTNVLYRFRPLISNPNPDPKYVNLGGSHMMELRVSKSAAIVSSTCQPSTHHVSTIYCVKLTCKGEDGHILASGNDGSDEFLVVQCSYGSLLQY